MDLASVRTTEGPEFIADDVLRFPGTLMLHSAIMQSGLHSASTVRIFYRAIEVFPS